MVSLILAGFNKLLLACVTIGSSLCGIASDFLAASKSDCLLGAVDCVRFFIELSRDKNGCRMFSEILLWLGVAFFTVS